MKEKLIQKILESKILNARQKWVLIKYIKNEEISLEKINKFIQIFDNEEEVIKKSKNEANQINLKKFEEWNKKLDYILEVEITKKYKDKENQSVIEDDATNQQLLDKLNSL